MMLERIGIACTIVVLVALPACVGENQSVPEPGPEGVIIKGGDERTGHYDVVEGWWESCAESRRRVVVGTGGGSRGGPLRPDHRRDPG